MLLIYVLSEQRDSMAKRWPERPAAELHYLAPCCCLSPGPGLVQAGLGGSELQLQGVVRAEPAEQVNHAADVAPIILHKDGDVTGKERGDQQQLEENN